MSSLSEGDEDLHDGKRHRRLPLAELTARELRAWRARRWAHLQTHRAHGESIDDEEMEYEHR